MLAGSMMKLGLNVGNHALSGALIDNGPACLLFCRKCGGVAEYYAKKLKDKCEAATENCKRNIGKIARGKHPSREAFLSDVWDITGEGTLHTAANAWWRDAGKTADDASTNTSLHPVDSNLRLEPQTGTSTVAPADLITDTSGTVSVMTKRIRGKQPQRCTERAARSETGANGQYDFREEQDMLDGL